MSNRNHNISAPMRAVSLLMNIVIAPLLALIAFGLGWSYLNALRAMLGMVLLSVFLIGCGTHDSPSMTPAEKKSLSQIEHQHLDGSSYAIQHFHDTSHAAKNGAQR